MNKTKRAIIVCSQDAFANGVKPREIEKYLMAKGYASVITFDSSKLSRLGKSGVRRYLPGPHAGKIELYAYEALLSIAGRLGESAQRAATSHVLSRVIVLRGALLRTILRRHEHYDLLICESNFDAALTLSGRIADIQILDLPAPFAEELWYGSMLSDAAYDKLRKIEIAAYAAADYLSFHWHTYADFVSQSKYRGDNFLPITYGTNPKTKTACFSDHPKIIFMGYLGGYWVNLPLLAQLCKLCPGLDVYGGPQPPATLGINYKGYAPSTEVIADYQFGLVTISNDELRRHSFSSKHLEYVSYGLPVLTPAWRKDDALDDSSIYYTADDFLDQLHRASSKPVWEQLHAAALNDAARFSWENALRPLDIQDANR